MEVVVGWVWGWRGDGAGWGGGAMGRCWGGGGGEGRGEGTQTGRKSCGFWSSKSRRKRVGSGREGRVDESGGWGMGWGWEWWRGGVGGRLRYSVQSGMAHASWMGSKCEVIGVAVFYGAGQRPGTGR